MCLSVITKLADKKESEGIGWKVFIRWEGKYEFEYNVLAGSETVPVGKWLTAENKQLYGPVGTDYLTGFHIFLTRRAAVEYLSGDDHSGMYRVVKVKYRAGRVLGHQFVSATSDQPATVIVADQMIIPRPIRRKK